MVEQVLQLTAATSASSIMIEKSYELPDGLVRAAPSPFHLMERTMEVLEVLVSGTMARAISAYSPTIKKSCRMVRSAL